MYTSNAFYHIEMAEESKQYIGFEWLVKFYQFKVDFFLWASSQPCYHWQDEQIDWTARTSDRHTSVRIPYITHRSKIYLQKKVIDEIKQ